MKILIQRVKKASVLVKDEIVGAIKYGILAFVGFEESDTVKDIKYLSDKLLNLRIFADDSDKMNLSVLDIKGELLLVSNFTLCGNAQKGNRPNYMSAAKPEIANELFEHMYSYIKDNYTINIQKGVFQAMMDVSLINDGPVTIWLESKNKLQ